MLGRVLSGKVQPDSIPRDRNRKEVWDANETEIQKT